MNTQINSRQVNISQKSEMVNNVSPSEFWKKVEFNRFGIIPVLILLIGCIGGLAAAFGALEDTVKLAMVIFPTIISLAFILAGAPMRVVIWTSAIAIVLDLLVLVL